MSILLSKLRFLLWYWGPPLALMGFIFFLSSQERVGVSDEFVVNFIVFKSLHIIEYALLQFLVFRALYRTFSGKNTNHILLLAFVITFLYAITDEFHQTLVPTRNGTIIDIGIDSIGILLSVSYTKLYLEQIRRFL